MGPRLTLAMLFLFATVTARNVQRSPATPQAPAPPAVNLSTKATALETLGDIGLQTRVPIGILPGKDAGVLCRTKTTFVFLGEDPRDALDAIAQQVHYLLNQEDGVFVLTAPDVTRHQLDVLNFRLHEFRSPKRETVQMIGAQLSGALWVEMMHGSGFGGSILHSADTHSADAPQLSLPRVLRDVTPLDVADRVVKLGSGGLYRSLIDPERAEGPADLTIRFSSYADPKQLKLDMSCPR